MSTTEHYDTIETRAPAAREAELFSRLPEILRKAMDAPGYAEHLGGVDPAQITSRAALSVASHGYIMEQGKVVLDGSAAELRDNEDVKEFYLGGAGDQRKSFKNLKSFKRRKRWL